jgi:hypothetical protein
LWVSFDDDISFDRFFFAFQSNQTNDIIPHINLSLPFIFYMYFILFCVIENDDRSIVTGGFLKLSKIIILSGEDQIDTAGRKELYQGKENYRIA